jgi:hypothetical protein
MSQAPVTVVELETFAREVRKVWNEDELADFIFFIAANPLAGRTIPETGGFRKLRWGRAGIGKRGGVRVIYFFFNPAHPLLLTNIYAKAAKGNLTQAELNELKALGAAIKREMRSGKKE